MNPIDVTQSGGGGKKRAKAGGGPPVEATPVRRAYILPCRFSTKRASQDSQGRATAFWGKGNHRGSTRAVLPGGAGRAPIGRRPSAAPGCQSVDCRRNGRFTGLMIRGRL